MLIFLALVFLLWALGALLFSGRGGFLIAGFNTLTPEERAKYDQKALCRFVGKLLFALSGCFLLIGVGAFLDRLSLVLIGVFLTLILVFGGTVYANTGNRFQKKE